MNLAYFAADTLGVTLYQLQSQLKASEVHQIRFGPWKIETQIDVTSDVMGGTELGFWVTVAKTLRLYVIIRDKENWLYLLNTNALQACGAATGFVGTTTKERTKEFKPAIKAVFRWKAGVWDRIQTDVQVHHIS